MGLKGESNAQAKSDRECYMRVLSEDLYHKAIMCEANYQNKQI